MDEFEEEIRPVLPQKLRERICDFPGGPDHGHTDCYFLALGANEIDRLREEAEGMKRALEKMAGSNQRLAELRDIEKGKRLQQITLTHKWRTEAKRLRRKTRLAAGEVFEP